MVSTDLPKHPTRKKCQTEIFLHLQLLSLTKGSTLALRLDNYADPINHIVFCVNLLYVNDNARISVTRVASYEPINGTIHKRDSGVEEDGKLSKE